MPLARSLFAFAIITVSAFGARAATATLNAEAPFIAENDAAVTKMMDGMAAKPKRGTRPSAPQDQRTASTYIFGAICPREGKGAALVMPRCCDTQAMSVHLVE